MPDVFENVVGRSLKSGAFAYRNSVGLITDAPEGASLKPMGVVSVDAGEADASVLVLEFASPEGKVWLDAVADAAVVAQVDDVISGVA